ncbi:MAG: YrzE family protein [Actinobacteria bacterium]|nr:YrzE family protein [Actinomycetota bacterium]
MSKDNEYGEARPTVGSGRSSAPADEVEVYKAKPHVTIDGRAGDRRFDIPATLGGFLAALGSLLLLGGLISAIIGAVGYQTGLGGSRDELSISGLIGGLIALFVAFLIGGWVAGRIARHRGAQHGLITAVWMIVLAALFAALGAFLGAEYDIFSSINAPQFFSADALTAGAIISGLVALAAMLLGGFLGGRLGERSSRIDDAELVETRRGVISRDGGILPLRREEERL